LTPSLGFKFDSPHRIEGLCVLVVDDEPDTLELLRALLEHCKARVLTATSAAEALRVVDESRPDVLITDIGMPVEDGYTLLRRLRGLPEERGGRTPVVALTAFAGGEDQVRGLESGFDRYFPKPIEPTELIVALADLTGRA
jgi:CheY-like chemotaxis protein